MAFTPDGIAPPGIPLLDCSPPTTTTRYRTFFYTNLLLSSLCVTDKQINLIWNFFAKVESDTGKAQCIECIKLYSLGSRPTLPGKQTAEFEKSSWEGSQGFTFSILRIYLTLAIAITL